MRRRRFARFVFWSAMAVTLAVALMPQPPELPGAPSDKVQHILAFATLALLARAAYPRASLLWLILGLSAFGALIELAQLIPALHRYAELADWIADTAAAAAMLLLIALVRRLRRRPDQS
jgi:VanZ family protein